MARSRFPIASLARRRRPARHCRRLAARANLVSGLQWRMIGPFRGGRVSAVTGVIGQPGTFYIGLAARRRLENHERRQRPGIRSSTA